MSLHTGNIISTVTPPGVGHGSMLPVSLRAGNEELEDGDGLAEGTARNLADDGAAPDDRRRIPGRRSESERLRAWLGGSALRRPRLRGVRAEVRAARDARHPGPPALPLLHGHPVREGMVRRSHQPRGTEGQFRRAVRLGRGGRGLADDLRDRRSRPASGARDVCGLHHEHPDAPGDSRRAREPGRGGRLQRDLPVRRRRANPLPVSLPRPLQAED